MADPRESAIRASGPQIERGRSARTHQPVDEQQQRIHDLVQTNFESAGRAGRAEAALEQATIATGNAEEALTRSRTVSQLLLAGLEVAKQQRDELIAEIDALTADNTTTTRELTQTTLAATRTARENRQLQTANAKLTQRNERLTALVATLKDSKRALEAKLKDAKTTGTAASRRAVVAEKELTTTRASADKQAGTIEALQAQSEKDRTSIQELQQALVAAQTDAERDRIIEQLRIERDQLLARKEELVTIIGELRTELATRPTGIHSEPTTDARMEEVVSPPPPQPASEEATSLIPAAPDSEERIKAVETVTDSEAPRQPSLADVPHNWHKLPLAKPLSRREQRLAVAFDKGDRTLERTLREEGLTQADALEIVVNAIRSKFLPTQQDGYVHAFERPAPAGATDAVPLLTEQAEKAPHDKRPDFLDHPPRPGFFDWKQSEAIAAVYGDKKARKALREAGYTDGDIQRIAHEGLRKYETVTGKKTPEPPPPPKVETRQPAPTPEPRQEPASSDRAPEAVAIDDGFVVPQDVIVSHPTADPQPVVIPAEKPRSGRPPKAGFAENPKQKTGRTRKVDLDSPSAIVTTMIDFTDEGEPNGPTDADILSLDPADYDISDLTEEYDWEQAKKPSQRERTTIEFGSEIWFRDIHDPRRTVTLIEEAAKTLFPPEIAENWASIQESVTYSSPQGPITGSPAIYSGVAQRLTQIARDMKLSKDSPTFTYLSAGFFVASLETSRGVDHPTVQSMAEPFFEYEAEHGFNQTGTLLQLVLYGNPRDKDLQSLYALMIKPVVDHHEFELAKKLGARYQREHGTVKDLFMKNILGRETWEPIETDADPDFAELDHEVATALTAGRKTIFPAGFAEQFVDFVPNTTDSSDGNGGNHHAPQAPKTTTKTPEDGSDGQIFTNNWQDHARCSKVDPETLFVQGAEQNDAKRICRGCPVQATCLATALKARIDFGVWGNATERERRAMLKDSDGVEQFILFVEGKIGESLSKSDPTLPSRKVGPQATATE